MTSATASVAAHQMPKHGPLGNAVKWAFKTGGGIEASPSIGPDEIVVGSRDGTIYAFR